MAMRFRVVRSCLLASLIYGSLQSPLPASADELDTNEAAAPEFESSQPEAQTASADAGEGESFEASASEELLPEVELPGEEALTVETSEPPPTAPAPCEPPNGPNIGESSSSYSPWLNANNQFEIYTGYNSSGTYSTQTWDTELCAYVIESINQEKFDLTFSYSIAADGSASLFRTNTDQQFIQTYVTGNTTTTSHTTTTVESEYDNGVKTSATIVISNKLNDVQIGSETTIFELFAPDGAVCSRRVVVGDQEVSNESFNTPNCGGQNA